MGAARQGKKLTSGQELGSAVSARQQRVVALYRAHREKIYHYLVGQGLDREVAQEVTQDVFVDLFVALERGTEVTSEQAWLYAVASRSAVDYWRREGRPMWVELEADLRAAANIPSPEPTPEAKTARRELLERVAASLSRLPKEQRACIHLRMEGFRYREIAKILKVSTSTAAAWLASAVERLRKEVVG